jgi:UDP-N-acetylmuramoyl-tripeptide--D-alanyl-D-alanine ligase
MLKIEEIYDIYKRHSVICTDTRAIEKDCIFFALKGENFDGNKFASEALRKGASFAIIDDKSYVEDERTILVDDVLKCLQDLASHHRNLFESPVIGITGSNGKTTTKELLNAILGTQYDVHATSGNFNNHIGVPLTLLKQGSEHNLMIIEMGANAIGEIAMLSNISDPDIGLITNIGKAHLKGFGSFEGVKKAKTELYSYIAHKKGLVFVNHEDELLMEASKGIRRKTYAGMHADVKSSYSVNEIGCVVVNLQTESGEISIPTNLFGGYNYQNVMAAIALGLHFGIEMNNIKKALSDYFPQNNRSQLIKTTNNRIILDAYNANPTSMQLAIKSFAELKDKNKMFVLGDMLELGDKSKEEHQAIVRLLESLGFKDVFLIGREFCETKNSFHTFQNVEEFSSYINTIPPMDFSILMKGSRGIGIEKSLDSLS